MNTRMFKNFSYFWGFWNRMKYFNERLKEALELRGMTPTNLAHRISVQGGYISKLLSGQISNTKHIGAISECLNVNIAWLKSGDGLPVVGTETHYTRYLSSCLFVGCTHSPRSHSYLCSRGFAPLPSRCNSKSIRYMSIFHFTRQLMNIVKKVI
ncbi:helix-turn-helix domain-containing protein [Photorhabdus antumapuensis]|uniref:helix-turn-helix domain-containing protein n=1 Tax=Photorhabdus antumapuensis TaxID=2862867 RepID=UPI0037C5D97E|nr:helix-turn-helix transcriptional regulator [Photorhabdus antumapuensis]